MHRVVAVKFSHRRDGLSLQIFYVSWGPVLLHLRHPHAWILVANEHQILGAWVHPNLCWKLHVGCPVGVRARIAAALELIHILWRAPLVKCRRVVVELPDATVGIAACSNLRRAAVILCGVRDVKLYILTLVAEWA